MSSKFTKRGLGTWQRQLPKLVLQRRRWWEVAVISVCLASSVVVLYWCLWWPVATSGVTVVSPNIQLEVTAITQLTKWMDEREQNKASSAVDARFNDLFQ